jgi:predicted transcriptional regulator
MSMVDELIAGILRGPGGFRDSLRRVLEEDLEMSIHEFCSRTGISQSTIYKIMQEEREPNLRTVRSVIHAIKRLENLPGGNFIAVIASRPVLNTIVERIVRIGNKDVKVKEYPATTMEEAIIAAVSAEKDGAIAVVCAPIVAPTIEKLLTVPVTVVIPKGSMLKAIEDAAEKSA